jgi:hypothetical protein
MKGTIVNQLVGESKKFDVFRSHRYHHEAALTHLDQQPYVAPEMSWRVVRIIPAWERAAGNLI